MLRPLKERTLGGVDGVAQGVEPVVRGVRAAVGHVLQLQGGLQMALGGHGQLDALAKALRMGNVGADGLGDEVHKVAGVALAQVVRHDPQVTVEGHLHLHMHHVGGLCAHQLHRAVGGNVHAALVGLKVHAGDVGGLEHGFGHGHAAGAIDADLDCLHGTNLLIRSRG